MLKVRVDATVLPVDATNVAASAGDSHESRFSRHLGDRKREWHS
jgi:hypothetical protein